MSSQLLCLVAAAFGMFTLLAASSAHLFWPRRLRLKEPVIFFTLVSVLLLTLRWPVIHWSREFNPDEAQMLAQGFRYLSHHVPWRDVDGTTSGPLNSLLLSTFLSLGAPLSFLTSRLVLWLALCFLLIFLYLTLRCFGTRSEVQFILMPTAFLYAFTIDNDFQHYSSETLPNLLLTAALCLMANEWKRERSSPRRLFLFGLLCGAVPFAKLQAAPLALFLGLAGILLVIRRRHETESSPGDWLKEIAALIAGAVIVPGLILSVVAANGAIDDFWKSYILASAGYTSESGKTRFSKILVLFSQPSDFKPYLNFTNAALLLLLTSCLFRKIKLRRDLFWPLVVNLTYCILTVMCFALAGKSHRHYLNLLVPPLTVLLGLVFLATRLMPDAAEAKKEIAASFSRVWPGLFLLLVLGCQIKNGLVYFADYRTHRQEMKLAQISIVAKAVLNVARPGDTMSIWGWMPVYYLETGLMPATRDAIGHYVISPGPLQDYFRQRYLRDLQASRPAVFIDAVVEGAFSWNWTSEDHFESFPELAKFIDANYSPWANVPLRQKGEPVRIYVLKERFAPPQTIPEKTGTPATVPNTPDK